jgi:lipid A 3-O-deacylase
MRRTAALLLPATFLLAAPAGAQELFGGLFAHDVETPITRSGQEGGLDLHLGWRGARLRGLAAVGAPSPHVFAAINTRGDTSYAGAGISWRIGGDMFLRPGIGMAVHDGPRLRDVTPERIDFGSRVLFVPEIAVGAQIDPRWSIEASWVHFSHAQIFSGQNPGSDNFGVRLSYRY